MERAIECATRRAKQEIPFRVVPGAGEAVGREAPLGLLLLRKSAPLGGGDPRSSLVALLLQREKARVSLDLSLTTPNPARPNLLILLVREFRAAPID
jgi:hypothetical protein